MRSLAQLAPRAAPTRAALTRPCRCFCAAMPPPPLFFFPFGCSSRGGSLSGLTKPCLGYSGPPSVCEGPFKVHSEKGNLCTRGGPFYIS